MPEGVLIVTGMPGAGKTTVARLLATQLPRAAHIETDRIQDLIVAGGLHPDREPRDEAESQLRLRRRNVAALADNFAAESIVPIIDEVLGGRIALDEYLALLSTRPVSLVVLAPRLDVSRRRDATRSEKQVAHLWRHLDEPMRRELGNAGAWIDTSELDEEETARIVLARLPEAVVAR